MPLGSTDILAHNEVLPIIQAQSAALIEAFHVNPRISSIFATQQRWLLAHAAMAMGFRDGTATMPRLSLSKFLAKVADYGIASRNTADAFIKEMLHYHYAYISEDQNDRRKKPLIVAPEPLAMLDRWICTHLRTLDAFDGGERLIRYQASPSALGHLEIEIAAGFLTAAGLREPEGAVSLFTWFNNGGIIMDWLTTRIVGRSPDQTRYLTSVTSISEIASWIKLSRTHLARKLREAEDLGSMGWTGKRGGSTMWVSDGFVSEVLGYQTIKLAIMDEAYERASRRFASWPYQPRASASMPVQL